MSKRRFGDRKDGRRVRSIDPMSVVSPYIMNKRSGCQNYLRDSFDTSFCDDYLAQKKKDGYKGMSIMHVLIAAYIRTVSQYPAINRFIAGQRVFSRNEIIVSLTIKREMTLKSPDTILKVSFSPDATVEDVYSTLNNAVISYRNAPKNDFDNVAKVLKYFPSFILKFSIGTLRFIDYFGFLPKSLQDVSPFHGSLFVTSMGSLGIPAIYHHLYDFGNLPVFMSFGTKRHVNHINDEGKVEKRSFIDTSFVIDERICDGFYFASAYKYMKRLLRTPELLEQKPEVIVADLD